MNFGCKPKREKQNWYNIDWGEARSLLTPHIADTARPLYVHVCMYVNTDYNKNNELFWVEYGQYVRWRYLVRENEADKSKDKRITRLGLDEITIKNPKPTVS